MFRPVKFIIQPVLVRDENGHLSEEAVEPVTIQAADLAGFPAAFEEQLAALNAPPTAKD